MPNIVDIHGLARMTGEDPESVQIAGRELFGQLSGTEPDLAKALVKASSASQLDPAKVLSILKSFAEVFEEPLEDAEGSGAIAKGIASLASAASDSAQSATEKARDVVSSINLADVKASGENLATRLRDEVNSIDMSALKDRAGSAGELLATKARSLASSIRKADKE